jgi:RNA polymerase sigma factor (sigma-70 family)
LEGFFLEEKIMEEDQHWVSQILRGNKQAYGHLIHKYKDKVYAIVLRMVQQPQDAQDITQECFIKAYRYLHSYDSSRRFSSWLYRIAINHCLDVKSNKQKKEGQNVNIEDVHLPDPVTPEHVYLKRESASELRHLIDKLPEMYRMILLLRYIHDLTYQEISDLLDIPLHTVQVRLHRAKQKLRDYFHSKREGGEYHEVSRY